MPAVTRIGDETSGICNLGLPCCPHGRCGINITGSPNVFVNKIPDHRLLDLGNCRCPHGGIYKSIQGSPNVFINQRPQTRIGDKTQCIICGCIGVHINGSPNVFANG